MARATINGLEIEYRIYGEGTPVLFIHGGFGGPNSSLLPSPNAITRDIPTGIQLITFDRRCAGESDYTLEWFDLADVATDAHELMHHLGFEQSIVVGSSMGGMVALQYVHLFSDSVTALGFMNTGADLMSHTNWGQRLAHQVSRHKNEGDEGVFAEYRERLRNPAQTPLPQDTSSDVRKQMEAARNAYMNALAITSDEDLCRYHAGMIRNASAFLGHDFTTTLENIAVPTLIVHGDADDVVPYEYGQQLATGITESTFVTIPNARHGILSYAEAREALSNWLLSL